MPPEASRWGGEGGSHNPTFDFSFKERFLLSGGRLLTFSGPLRSYTLKKNHIGLVVIEILRYTQYRKRSFYFYLSTVSYAPRGL